jgi:heme/copper-type cytochrome/quinol oxidase subunit 3
MDDFAKKCGRLIESARNSWERWRVTCGDRDSVYRPKACTVGLLNSTAMLGAADANAKARARRIVFMGVILSGVLGVLA